MYLKNTLKLFMSMEGKRVCQTDGKFYYLSCSGKRFHTIWMSKMIYCKKNDVFKKSQSITWNNI